MTGQYLAGALLILTLIGDAVARSASNDPLPKLISAATPGIVTVLSYNPDLAMPSIGTGFFVAPDRVVTARHVVARTDRANIRTSDGRTVGIAGILAEERSSDLVLVQLKRPVEGARALNAASEAPEAGERLFTVSSPLGLEYSAADGIVSAYREVPGAGVSMQHTVAVSPGSSGCPLLNDRGEVVAVQTGVITAGRRIISAGQSLNFAVSAKLIASMRPGALRTLAECRDDVPADWRPPITRGIDAISLHPLTRSDFKASVPFFEQAAKDEPDEPDAWFRLALCLEKAGERARAMEAYRKAIALKPDFATALNNLAAVHIARREHADAAKLLVAAVKAKPDYAAAYSNLAVACVHLSNWQGAADAARHAIRLDANQAEAHLNLGVASLQLGDVGAATQAHERLQKLDKSRAERLGALLKERAGPDRVPN